MPARGTGHRPWPVAIRPFPSILGNDFRMHFDAKLELDGKTATGITVPSEIIDSLGAGRRPAVQVTVNGHTFSTTIGSMKGAFKIPVSAERRRLIHAEAGESIRVTIVVDDAPTEIEVPTDLAEALETDQAAADFFAALTASQRKGFITPIQDAKTADTRARRVEKALTALQARQKRP
jgi:hypothetical protein